MENIECGGTACDVSEMIPTAELEAERLRFAMLHDYEDDHGNSIKGHHTNSKTRRPKAGIGGLSRKIYRHDPSHNCMH